MISYWHDIPVGDEAPNIINVIIEIPKGSPNKYEIDKDTGLIKLDRANYSNAPYPFDYGFSPKTYWDDNDPLDVVVLGTFPLHPGILVEARPVGVMKMIDGGESDWKILAVPVEDMRWEQVKDISDINDHTLKEIRHFFETYKELKKGKGAVTVEGFGDRSEALSAIEKAIALYNGKFSEGKSS